MNAHIRRAESSDLDAVVQVLHEALADDPFVQWLVEADPQRRRAYVRLMVRDIALPRGEVHVASVEDRLVGAALWAPPQSFELGPWDAIRLMPRMLAIVGWTRMGRVSDKLQQVEAARPRDPYWLLTLLGIARDRRRLGLGSSLMRPILDRCDAEGLACACETADPDNLPFYERLGFGVSGQRRLELSGPTSWSLVRPVGRLPPQPPPER